MKVTLKRFKGKDHGLCIVDRGDGRKIYVESLLMHHIKKELIKQGHDVIKKLMWKDGHMMSDLQYYLRSRKIKSNDAFMLYDGKWMIRKTQDDYNNGRLELIADFNIFIS